MAPADLVPVATSSLLAVFLTWVVRSLARKWGVVARPRPDRWHRKPTALLGGVAIFATVALHDLIWGLHSVDAGNVLAAASLLFAVGLVDDLWRIRPYQKLLGQLAAAGWLVAAGLSLDWTGWPIVDGALTLVWLVGITNALNLLDNMDGLAAGAAAVAAVFFAAHFWDRGLKDPCLHCAVFAAALLGFLVFNANPASIFMGDSGSLFIGFFLASGALAGRFGASPEGWWDRIAFPILTLAVPIWDTTLVTVLRLRAGRSIAQGGRDHSSHRLVALGLSERAAVATLYGLAAAGGVVAWLGTWLPTGVGSALAAGFLVLLAVLGLRLARVKPYG